MGMTLTKRCIKARLSDRYTAAELADMIWLAADLFLDYFLDECIECLEAFDIEEDDSEYSSD